MAASIGLTGGIGSGKSTVAERFAELGVQVIDADQIARRITAPGSAQFEQIVSHFGDDIVDADGCIDRKRLGRMVFESAHQRKHLESILHPPIRAEMRTRAQRDEQRYCILDIPLLVESGQHRDMDRVITIACAREKRIARLRQRGMTATEIERVMQTQASEQQRLAAADDVIDNNGDVEAIVPQVQKLHRAYLDLFAELE